MDIPVTTPEFVTDATFGFELTQVPPEVGLRIVVLPTHRIVPPVILTNGLSPIVTGVLRDDEHPVEDSVYIKVAVPIERAVTKPELLTDATEGLLLIHVPPPIGVKLVVPLIQMLFDPVNPTVGLL